MSKYAHILVLAIAAAAFILFKIPHLSLAYFWDELGVYAHGALYMHDHGLGILPAALPPDLSRGHPLLFYFLHALNFRIFGDTILAGHIFSLGISIATFFATYIFAKDIFNKNVALGASLLLLAQPIFIAQSALILPEMLLTFFTVLAIYFFLKENLWLYVLFACCAVLVKETGVVTPAACGLFLFINKKYSLKNIVLTASPLVILALFFLIQKIQNGWFLFPYHTGYISFGADFWRRLSGFTEFIFVEQKRIFITLISIAGLFALFYKKHNIPSPLLLLGLLIMVMIIFSAANFYMERYLLMILPAVCISAAFLYDLIFKDKKIFYAVITALAFLSLLKLHTPSFNYDADMGYEHVVKVQKEATRFLEQNISIGELASGNFPFNMGTGDKRKGFVTSGHIPLSGDFDQIKWIVITRPGDSDYQIPENIETDTVQIFQSGFAKAFVMKINNKQK